VWGGYVRGSRFKRMSKFKFSLYQNGHRVKCTADCIIDAFILNLFEDETNCTSVGPRGEAKITE
jgi:hypothetical protein